MSRVRCDSKRWLDADCPDGVLCIFDDKRHADRYTVIYREVYEYDGVRYLFGRGMSERPQHPQGFGMSFEMKLHEVSSYRARNQRRKVKWSELPEDVKRCIIADLTPEPDTSGVADEC